MMALLVVSPGALAAPLTFTNDLVGDYTGNYRCEIYGVGAGFEDGKLHFEIRTNTAQSGFWGSDGRAYTHFSPGDIFIAVGTLNPFDSSAAIHGIATTSHDNVVQQAYGGETWDYVQEGNLYTNATFADGTFESYQYWCDRLGRTYHPDDQDGNDCQNSYPTLIKTGTEVLNKSSLTYSSVCGEPWDYEITGWVDTDAIGLECGMDFTMFFAPECGNDGGGHNGTAPCPPTGDLRIIKFEDLNENGTLDCGEDRLPDWEFEVTGPDSYYEIVTTELDGSITIEDLTPGLYTVTELLQAGWEITSTNPLGVTIYADQLSTVHFGNVEEPTPPPIPEPAFGSFALLGLLAVRRRRR
jgi:MYXO-CTERM domain-containing protein